MERLSEALESYLGLDAENAEEYAKRSGNWRRLVKSRFGMSANQFEELLKLQNGVCPICGEPPENGPLQRAFDIDHDNETKLVRGLLCSNCNRGLGYFQDDPTCLLRAAAYLKNPPAVGLEPRPIVRFDRTKGRGNLVRYDGSLPIRSTAKRPRAKQL